MTPLMELEPADAAAALRVAERMSRDAAMRLLEELAARGYGVSIASLDRELDRELNGSVEPVTGWAAFVRLRGGMVGPVLAFSPIHAAAVAGRLVELLEAGRFRCPVDGCVSELGHDTAHIDAAGRRWAEGPLGRLEVGPARGPGSGDAP